MPRNMSFALTQVQMRCRVKTVTRRDGWDDLRPGDLFYAVEKVRGLKKGEKVKRIALLRCKSNRRVRLDAITYPDVVREGFPEMTRAEFVAMFCRKMGGPLNRKVNRIEFEYVEEGANDVNR